MKETGLVINTNGEYATVKVEKKDECSKCGMCLFPKGADSVTWRAKNLVNAVNGDTVVIDTEKEGKLLGALLVFLVPLLLIGLSVLVGYLVIGNELSILILSVLLIALWFIVLSIIDKKLKKSAGFTPIITAVINKEKN